MMVQSPLRRYFSRREIPFLFLTAFAICLFVAGGASRADVPAQVIIRSTAWLLLLATIVVVRDWHWKHVRGPFVLLAGILVALLVQLLPLPAEVWTTLPGRESFQAPSRILNLQQPWRPLSISPGATLNAAASLVVPLVVLALGSQFSWRRQRSVLSLMVAFISASCIWAIAQFVGAMSPNPLMNYMPGQTGGPFANRNHLALLLAVGLLILPVWCFQSERNFRIRAFWSVGMAFILILVVLAIGSRAGLVLAPLGALAGLLIVRAPLEAKFRASSRAQKRFLLIAGTLTTVGGVAVSGLLDRSATVDRLLELDVGADLRARAAPTVLEMIWRYFPAGTGFGTFDPAFRMSEPDLLLNPSYLNHAHNDFLEILLDGGLIGVLLMGACVAWWLIRSAVAWRDRSQAAASLRQTGSAIILLVLVASLTDYPARTPIFMAFLSIAAIWLALESDPVPDAGLPARA